MEVTVVAHTRFWAGNAADVTGNRWQADGYDGDTNDGGFLAEFAGRGCYESWNRPNPDTATNEGYLQHIFDVEHLSVIEHGAVSLHFAGVSRSFTHELIRHRHFSFSQLSQRYAKLDASRPVVPPLFHGDVTAEEILNRSFSNAVHEYGLLVDIGTRKATEAGYTGTMAKKRAQEAARAVLPNMTPTKLVVSGNHRSWVEFLLKRGGTSADLEIRRAAFIVYGLLVALEPSIYGNIELVEEAPDWFLRLKLEA